MSEIEVLIPETIVPLMDALKLAGEQVVELRIDDAEAKDV